MTEGLLTVLHSSENGSLFCESVEWPCQVSPKYSGDSSMPSPRTNQVAVSINQSSSILDMSPRQEVVLTSYHAYCQVEKKKKKKKKMTDRKEIHGGCLMV